MSGRSWNRATAVWLVLVAATVVVWSVAERRVPGRMTTVMFILVAAFKARLVFLEFMELSTTRPPWRAVFESWIAACSAAIIALYWYSPG